MLGVRIHQTLMMSKFLDIHAVLVISVLQPQQREAIATEKFVGLQFYSVVSTI